jgi:hypothetical protein
MIMCVRGLSFVDRAIEPRQYVITWSMGLLMVMIVMVAAMIDAMNSLRLYQAHASAEVEKSTLELVDAIQKHKSVRSVAGQRKPLNGHKDEA